MADFSSAGPTPISLQPKPDVTAPGVDVLSSVPAHAFEALDGTSMATPHVAGACCSPPPEPSDMDGAAGEIGARLDGTRSSAPAVRRGIDAARGRWQHRPPPREPPLLFTRPTSVGWGLVPRGFSGTKQLSTADAGGGERAVDRVDPPAVAATRARSSSRMEKTLVAGSTLALRLAVSKTAAAGNGTGFVVLTRGADVRRVAVLVPRRDPEAPARSAQDARRAGHLHGNTRRAKRRALPRTSIRSAVSLRECRRGSAARSRSSGSGCASRSRTSASPSSAGTAAPGLAASCSQPTTRTARRLHRAFPRAEPVRQASADAAPVVGSRPARRRARTTSSSTRRRPRKTGRVHVPLLGQ